MNGKGLLVTELGRYLKYLDFKDNTQVQKVNQIQPYMQTVY